MSDGRGENLKPSMRCEAEIILGNVADALVVPVQAVFNEGPVRYVHVQQTGQGSSNRYTRRPIVLGQRSDRFAEIRAGLKEGDRVLVRRPEAGEVLPGGWQESDLAVAGLKFSDDGQVVPVGWTPGSDGRGGRPPAGMGGPGGERRPGQRPGQSPAGGNGPDADGAGKAADDAAAKDATKADEPAVAAEPAKGEPPAAEPAAVPEPAVATPESK
jgi:hypothetical protein